MKKLLYILILSFFIHPAFAQEQPGAARLREKMVEYIQDRLGLSKPEAEKFQPVFLDYFRELKNTNQEFRGGDRLILQQKVVELRLRYRDQFKPIIGEKRSNDVFAYERDFVKTIQEIRNQRMENKPESRANKRKGGEL